MTMAGPPAAGHRERLRTLVIEDNELDAGLAVRALTRAGMAIESVVVEDEAGLRAALSTFVPDIVLCDFSLPGFDGFAALRIVHETYPDAPLIFVSGTISEERAALALQSGAADYVMKSSLIRLPIAVERAVDAARLAARRADRARWQVQRLERLWRVATDPLLRGSDIVQAILQQATIDVDSDFTFRAFLCRSAGTGRTVVDCTSGAGALPVGPNEIAALQALVDTPHDETSRTRSWSDTTLTANAPAALAGAGWRAVITSQFEAAGDDYEIAFASKEPVETFGEHDHAYLNVLVSTLAHQIQVDALETSLRDEEERSRQHAQRLEGSWQIVNDARIKDVDKWLALLTQAAKSISPGQGFRGTFWRLDGEDMICEAVGEAAKHQLRSDVIKIGARVPSASSPVASIIRAGLATQSWDDIEASNPEIALARASGTRACILTVFKAGGASWVISLASGRSAKKGFGPLDRSFVEALASFFSSHVQQRWQFARIQYQQSHDALTGLLNRPHFRSQARSLAIATENYAIALVDINAFHEVNDSFGHIIGDAVLVEVGSSLAGNAQAGEILGRIGGDVFAIFIADPPSSDYVMERVRAFAGVFRRTFSTGDRDGKEFVACTASIGAAAAQGDGSTFETIFSRADAALAIAKERGVNAIVAYEPGMERDAQRRAILRSDLSAAIAEDQFELYFQPHVELSTGRVSGCEALIRWNHPKRGLVMPDAFIPFAEQTGMITDIDTWVMNKAIATATTLSATRPDFRLFFNLSGRQAGDSAIVRGFVKAARAGVNLENIGIEITETDAMRNIRATSRVCRALRKLNVQIAIDDFGVGYSSLSSLKSLPINAVKIDRTFVSGVMTNAHDAAIAKTIISIADHFGFASVGEGAETPAEIEWLRKNGCRYVQGYGIARPMPFDAFNSWLANRKPESPARARARAGRSIPVERHEMQV
jgi:diguanylate cyclase (GGDEF)-like protein